MASRAATVVWHHCRHRAATTEDDRIELLEGRLVEMSLIGPRHALAVDALTEWLVVAGAGRARVTVQKPIGLDDAKFSRSATMTYPWT